MSIQKSLVLASICSFAMLLAACGSDKNSSSPTADTAANSAATFAKSDASGLFAGELKSNTGANGGLLNMSAGSGASDSSADVSGSVSAVLDSLSLSNNGSTLSQEIVVAGFVAPIQFTTTFDGTSWVGSLTAPGSKTVYTFKLSRVAEKQAAEDFVKLAPMGTYKGKFVYAESGGKRAATILVEATPDLGESLLALFTPQSPASVEVIYDGGSKESVTSAVWNSVQRTLMATGPAMTSMGAPDLQCKLDELENLDCVLAMGKTRVAGGKFIRQNPPVVSKPKPVATPKPTSTPKSTPAPTPAHSVTEAPDTNDEVLPDPTPAPIPELPANSLTKRTFKGKATFTDKMTKKSNTKNVAITVEILAANVPGPVGARVTFMATNTRVGAEMRDASYDSNAKTLNAQAVLKAGALAGALILKCSNVDFQSPSYNFGCTYESTTSGVTATFQMSGSR